MSRRPDHDWVLPKDSPLPLYQQIQDLVLAQIETGKIKVGESLPSYPWLSKNLKVADKTVRQATLALQQAGVLSIQRGKGTFVLRGPESTGTPKPLGPGSGVSGRNQLSPNVLNSAISQTSSLSFRTTKTGQIGVIPPNLPVENPDENMLWGCLRGIHEAGFERHQDIILLTRIGDLRAPGAAENLCMPRRMDGVIVLTPAPEAFYARLGVLGLPAVAIGSSIETAHTPYISISSSAQQTYNSVNFDFTGAARELTYRLIGKGHKSIGFLGHPRGPGASMLDEGFRHAMGAAGLPIRPEWVVRVDTQIGDSGRAAADHVLAQGLTAVITADHTLARILAQAAGTKGVKIPGQLAIVSVLEAWKAELPGGQLLEGAFLDARELGRRAAQRLDELITATDPLPRRELLEALRVEGASL